MGPNRRQLHQAQCNRASVLVGQNRDQDAISQLDEVLSDNPCLEIRELALLNKGLTLVHATEFNEALPILEAVTSPDRRAQGAFALAYCYYISERIDEAIAIWSEIITSTTADVQDYLILELLLSSYRRISDNEGADKIIGQLRDEKYKGFESEAIIAQDDFFHSDKEIAITRLKSIADDAKSEGNLAATQAILLRLGELYARQGQHLDAIQIWEDIGFENLYPPIQIRYFDSLQRTNRIDEAIEVAEKIRRERFDRHIAEIEVQLLTERDQWREAKEVCEQLLNLFPTDIEFKILLAAIVVQDGDIDKARSTIQKVEYLNIKDDADKLRRVAWIHHKVGLEDAMQLAFRARQLDFGNPISHNIYMQVAMEQESIPESPVDAPCTIRLRPVGVTDERQFQSFTILIESPFDLPRGFIAASHPFAQRLLTLQPGEAIVIQEELSRLSPPIQDDRPYELADRISHLLHACHETIKKSGSLFGPQVGFVTFDLNASIEKFWDLLDEAGRDLTQLLSLYKEWKVPITSIGRARGKNLLDLWVWFSQNQFLGIHAGSTLTLEESVVEALKLDTQKPVLILDSVSIVTIVCLRIGELISRHFRLVAPTSLFEEVQSLRFEPMTNLVSAELPKSILDFLNSFVEILPCTNVHLLPPTDVKRWSRLVGEIELHAALLTKELDGILLTDDQVIGHLIEHQLQKKSVNVGQIINFLHDAKAISDDRYIDLVENLLAHNYSRIRFNGELIAALLREE